MPTSTRHLLLQARRLAPFAMAAGLALAGEPASALSVWDEVTFYLTPSTFTPGGTVSTTFTFGSRPGMELSGLTFSLHWDSALAAPLASGPGSVADWAALLGAKGSVTYLPAAAQTITGVWAADPLGGAASFISTDYCTRVKT